MGFELFAILQLERSRYWRLVKLVSPKGKTVKSLFERSRTERFEKAERRARLVNLLFDKFIARIDETGPESELGSKPIDPPNRFFDRLRSTKVEIDQNQPGTEPWRELLERSTFCNWEMFLRNFHEMMPLRFLDERVMCVIGGFGQEGLVGLSQVELKPETKLKAFETSCWSLLLHEESTREKRSMKGMNLRMIFIS